MAKTILFVCTGNTCRSPMAAVLANDYLKKWGFKGQAFSAGLGAVPNLPAAKQAQKIMAEWGLDLSKHRSRALNEELWQKADLVLTMTQAQKEYLQQLAVDKKVFLFKEYAQGENKDVGDPFGGSEEVYRACAQELAEGMPKIIKRFRGEDVVKIALGADHGGFRLKEIIKEWLAENNYEFEDLGTFSEEACDYPEIALQVAAKVAAGECQRGIIVCGTGIGVSIMANKVRGIRAALCHDLFSAKASREHNQANLLTLGERVIGPGLALEIVAVWLKTPFAGGRHARRVAKIIDYENQRFDN